MADQAAHPPYGSNLTYPLDHYVRLHQTSGSGGVSDSIDLQRCSGTAKRTVHAATRRTTIAALPPGGSIGWAPCGI